MSKFTVEEINFMCVFGGESRMGMIEDIKRIFSHLQDGEMAELAEQVLRKLQNMADKEFSELVLEAAE